MSSSIPPLLFFLSVLFSLCFAAPSSSLPDIGVVTDPPRSKFRAINRRDAADAAIDLTAENFDVVLRESPASFAIVEFFAHWCPACRNYKPHYEKVARLFNGPDAVHRGIVLMTRVDCAMKEAQTNAELCNRFSVQHYPMLLWGPPARFAFGGWKPRQEKSRIKSIDDGRRAERLLNWINKEIGSEFNLADEKHEQEDQLLPNGTDPEQILVGIRMPSVVENISKPLLYPSDSEEVHDLKHWVHGFLKAAHELFKIPEKMADVWGKHVGLGSSSANLSGGPGVLDLKKASVSNGGAPVGADRHISRAAFGRKFKGYFQDLRSASKANK